MRRATSFMLAVLASFMLVAAPASADRPSDRGHHGPPIAGSGSFQGTGVYERWTVCPFAWEIVTGTFDDAGRPGADGTFTLDYCVTVVGEGADLWMEGTFTVQTTAGITLSGTLAGGTNLVGGPADVQLTLTVLESTGAPRPITGTISLTGKRTQPAEYTSTFIGTFTTDLRIGR